MDKKTRKLIEDVINSADNTGCTGDLTVASKKAIDNLSKHINKPIFTAAQLNKFRKAIMAWIWEDEKDTRMVEACNQDRADLMAVLDAIKSGDYKTAAWQAGRLDTIVRDIIPNDIYDALMGDYDE